MVYQGGKTKYCKYIVPILQNAIDKNSISTFIDGCCGGCAIVDKIKCENRIAIDNNKYLIAFLRKVTKEGANFIPEISPSKDEWDKVKNNKDNYSEWYVGFVEHLCSFNARGFIGGYGAACNSRNYYAERRQNIMKQADSLLGINFIADDINNLKAERSVIYIDPPYNKTQIYDSLAKVPFDYDKFWNTVRHLSQDNLVFVSEEEAPKDFDCVWLKTVERNIRGSKKITTEGLFRYKGE